MIIGVLASAWVHDFGAWCTQVYPLFHIVDRDDLAFVQLVVPVPTPMPVAIEAMPKWKQPAPPAPKIAPQPVAAKGALRRNRELRECALLGVLSAREDEGVPMASLFAKRLGEEDALSGAAIGGVVGGSLHESHGAGGLGLSGVGVGGGGKGEVGGVGPGAKGEWEGGGPAVGTGRLGAHSAAWSEWTARVAREVGQRWTKEYESSTDEPLSAVAIVQLRVSASGTVKDIVILKSAGLAKANVALLIVLRASPLPPPPADDIDGDGEAEARVSVRLAAD